MVLVYATLFSYCGCHAVLPLLLLLYACVAWRVQELRVHGWVVVDGLISRDLATALKVAALGLMRKGACRAHPRPKNVKPRP